jgi:GR25 family glycosyltransferase involved in LPS biosynthesis
MYKLKLMNIDKFYFINLDKRPNRKDHFLEQCKRENIPPEKIERFSALDGETYNFSPQELKMFEKSDFISLWFANRIIGNQLSHYYIMQDMLKRNLDYIVVFQDDSILRNNFLETLDKVMDNLPKNAEMVNMGLHKYNSYDKFIRWDLTATDDHIYLAHKRMNKYVCILKDGINPCSLAYILTKRGAENMTKYFQTNGFLRATDGNFNDYLKNNKIFYGSTPVLVTGNEYLQSDIFIK